MSNEKEPNYLKEALMGESAQVAFSVAVALIIANYFIYGSGGAVTTAVSYVAGVFLAGLFVPDMQWFRASVDEKYRNKNREINRDHLINELDKLCAFDNERNLNFRSYRSMRELVKTLYDLASTSNGNISKRDVERMDDATVNFLSMWLAELVIEERQKSIDVKELNEKIQHINTELKTEDNIAQIRQLKNALKDYQEMLERHERMRSRGLALEAALISMPDQMKEIYQSVITANAAGDMSINLDEKIEQLRIQEDVQAELSVDYSEILTGSGSFSQKLDRKVTQMQKEKV